MSTQDPSGVPAAVPAAQAPAADAAAPAAAAPSPAAKPAQAPAAKPAPRKFARPAPTVAPVIESQPAEAKTDAARESISKGALTKMRSKLEAAEKSAGEAASLREELAHYAKQELDRAPEKARKYVLAKHKDDPRAQLAELRSLRESGLLDEPKPSPVDQPQANTAPPKSPTPDDADPDVVAARRYKELQSNPATFLIASSFHSKNSAAIKRGEQKLSSRN